MFTVKHITRQGSEAAVEAATYRVVRDRETGSVSFTAYEKLDDAGSAPGHYFAYGSERYQRGDDVDVIYVINESGATVSALFFYSHMLPVEEPLGEAVS